MAKRKRMIELDENGKPKKPEKKPRLKRMTLAERSAMKSHMWRVDPDHPSNQPPPIPPISSPEQAHAVAVSALTEAAKKRFSSFFQLYPPNRPYIYGRHTLDKLRRMDSIMESFAAGESTYTIFEEPPRHGKSDTSSKRAPAWFHATFPTEDVIIAANTFDLASEFSDKNREILVERSGLWGKLPSKGTWARDRWALEGNRGVVNAIGVGGTITGRGGAFVVIDDPYKDRDHVESEVGREEVWTWFRSVIFTRRAPVCAMIISMQRWHPDDLVGKIRAKNDPNSPNYDPFFPKFTIVSYPAQSPDYITPENPGGWLFPERFSEQFYLETRAATMEYAWNSQYMQQPAAKYGNMFPVRVAGSDPDPTVHIIDDMPIGFYERGWDIASSTRQLGKDDPDYTASVKAAIIDNSLYVSDACHFRQLAGARNQRIVDTALSDGPEVRVRMETVAGYVDAYSQVSIALSGQISVLRTTPHHDKVSRAHTLVPFFEAGRVYLKRGPWNDAWIQEFRSFSPTGSSGSHDDLVDATEIAVHDQITRRSGNPVITAPLTNLKIKYKPILYTDNDGHIRKRFSGIKRFNDLYLLDTYEPKGTLIRGTWLGRREGSCSHLVFIDRDNSWHVVDTIESIHYGNSLGDFASAMLLSTFDTSPLHRKHFDLYLDIFSSDDSDEVQYALEEVLDAENSLLNLPDNYSTPVFVTPATVDGISGIDVLDQMAQNTANNRPRGLYIYPPTTITALRDARTRPVAVGKENTTGKEDLDLTPNARALKLLAALYRG